MRTLAVILARSGSKRLKNKLFLKINKNIALDFFFNRLKKVKAIDEIIIATSKKKSDDKIYKFAKVKKIKCFRGPEKNVLKRFFLSTFKSKKKPELIVRANADCVLMMPTIVDKDIKSMKNKKYDLLTPFNRNFCPFGYSFVIFKPKALEKIYKRAKKRSHLEHIENYCFDNEKNFKILRPKYDMQLFYPKLKLTLDEKKDYKKLKFFYNMIKKVPIKNQPKKLISLAKSSKFYV